MKVVVGCLLGALISLGTWGQNETEALRYSWLGTGGTARFNGMAGAFGALGADLSVAATNPAGLARYNRSEFAITPGYTSYNTSSSYNGTNAAHNGMRLNFSNVGFLAATKLKEDNFNLWKSLQVAITYNKLAVFNQSSIVAGRNTNSLLAVFALQANGFTSDQLQNALPFTAWPAWLTYAIDPSGTSSTEYTHQFLDIDTLYQQHQLERKGGMYETGFSISANYNNKFYLGLTVALPSVRFEEVYSHAESIHTDSTPALTDSLTNITYISGINTRGNGINAKFGIIYLPNSYLRFGLAIQTKSWISLHDTWSTALDTDFDTGTGYSYESVVGNYNYFLTTPGRYTFSVAGILGRHGALNADIEYLDYSTSKLKTNTRLSPSYSFQAENDSIRAIYRDAFNIRVGGELRLNKRYFFRTGFALQGNPYDERGTQRVVNDPIRKTLALGVGYRKKEVFFDLAYNFSWWNADYYLYDPTLVNEARLENTLTNITATLGLRY